MIPRLNIAFPIKRQWQYWFGKEYEPLKGEYLLNHARTGIVMALKASVPEGSRVGVVAYNCHTVANAVVNAGCKPVFVDVTEELKIDIASVPANLDAIVVTNLFGIRNDIEAIRKRCPKAIIIVDNAHGYGLPAEGDFTVYSINQGKFPALGCGGILCVNIKENKNKENTACAEENDSKSKTNNPAPQDTAYAASSVIANHLDDKQAYLQSNCQSLSDNCNKLPSSDYSEKNDSTFESTKNTKNNVAAIDEMYAALPSYRFMGQMKLFCSMLVKAIAYSRCMYWLTMKMKKSSNPKVHEKVVMMKMAPGVRRMYQAALPEIPKMINLQRQNAAKIGDWTLDIGHLIVGENAFMAVVRTEKPEELKREFASKGVETETHFKHCIEWAKQFGYIEETCPNAEKLINHLLMIPTYSEVRN